MNLFKRISQINIPQKKSAWAGGQAGLAASLRFGFRVWLTLSSGKVSHNTLRPHPRKNYFLLATARKFLNGGFVLPLLRDKQAHKGRCVSLKD